MLKNIRKKIKKHLRSSNHLLFLLIGFCIHTSTALGSNSLWLDDTPIDVSIYSDTLKKHNSLYNWMWGKHYRKLYYKPVRVESVTLNSLYGGLSFVRQVPELYGLLFNDKQKQFYLLKPLGTASSFLESGFFKTVYDPKSFKNTYLGDFLEEAYTIEHPYLFMVSDKLAKIANLNSGNTSIYHISKDVVCSDTIADGTSIQDKLVSIYELPDLQSNEIIADIDTLLNRLHDGGRYKINREKYIRARLFDMLIGDWNKIPENWAWIASTKTDTIVYDPMVLDRSQAFTKVDGVFFRELLNMLGLNFITGYDNKLKNVSKFNSLGYAQDVALTIGSNKQEWLEQADELQRLFTDSLIDVAFERLPHEMQDNELFGIKEKLKERRKYLDEWAADYYRALQKTPVITGTNGEDRIIIEDDDSKNLNIQIFNKQTNQQIFSHKYNHKETKEIWLYSLGGDDTLSIRKKYKGIPLLLIGGKGNQVYDIEQAAGVKLYGLKDEKKKLDSLENVKVVIPSDEKALDYDYEKSRYTKWSFTPIGVYDSDLGLNIGTSLSYTIYGFRRSPFTRQHQFSYNYSSGFVYQGIFPDYDSNRSFHVSAFVGSPAYFSNFFGFGNETAGHKGEKKRFNRVNLNKYTITPAFYYTINKEQEINVFGSVEMFKVSNPKDRDRYINQVFGDDNDVFKTKTFIDLGMSYTLDKKMEHFISSLKFVFNSGWTINVADPGRNFPYLTVDLGVNLKFTDRLTLATLMKGKALFSNKYEFYQSATTELRGFRNNRFIGRQSFYEYTDLRLDMGRLENPLTPINYGVFLGMDHGRVWYPDEDSKKWYTSYGGGVWLTLFKQFTGKFSYFVSKDDNRFMFELGFIF